MGCAQTKPGAESVVATADVDGTLGSPPKPATQAVPTPIPAVTLTAEQLEGQRIAAAAIEVLVEKIPPELKDTEAPRPRKDYCGPGKSYWNGIYCKGDELEKLMRHTDL